MLGLLVAIPVLYRMVDKLCTEAEETERTCSKEYVEATLIGDACSRIPGVENIEYPAEADIPVHVAGVGVLLCTPNEARDLARHHTTPEFKRALGVALARNRKEGRVA